VTRSLKNSVRFRVRVPVVPTDHAGVFTDGAWLYTRNRVPGRKVYGELLREEGGVEYRRWDAERSKLAAYLKRGGRIWPFRETSFVLYLGAASGTTVSHLSDVCSLGTIVAVEISPRSFRDLVRLAESRTNVLPVLADAAHPDTYGARAAHADVLYQDVAQRDQEGLFQKNLSLLGPGRFGFLIVKSRSADVAAEPAAVFRAATDRLRSASVDVIDVRTLDPFAKDHAAIVVRTTEPQGAKR